MMWWFFLITYAGIWFVGIIWWFRRTTGLSSNVLYGAVAELADDHRALAARLDKLAGQGLSYDDEGRLNVGGTTGRITVSENNVDIDPSYQGQSSITVTGRIKRLEDND